MRVVIVLADPFLYLRMHPHCLSIRDVVASSRSHLFIPCLEVLITIDAGNRSEVYESSPIVAIDHDIDFLEIAMDDFFFIEEQ